MEYKFTIKGTLPGLNEYLQAERRFVRKGGKGYSAGNEMKQQFQCDISYVARSQLKRLRIEKPVHIIYHYFEPNMKRDLDNISGVAHKFIHDALVQCKILQGDGWKHITGFTDHFSVDRDNPRIEVTIIEAGDCNG